MKFLKLTLVLVFLFVTVVVVLIFTGTPDGCRRVEVASLHKTPEVVFQEINAFMAGESSELVILDGDATELFNDWLDPSIEDFKMCFLQSGIVVSGTAVNQFGWPLHFRVKFLPELIQGRVEVSSMDFSVGEIDRLPMVQHLLTRKVKKLVKQKLGSVSFDEPISVSVTDGYMKLYRL